VWRAYTFSLQWSFISLPAVPPLKKRLSEDLRELVTRARNSKDFGQSNGFCKQEET